MADRDLRRLVKEYADREHRLAGQNVYSLFNQAHLFAIQGRQRHVLDLLASRPGAQSPGQKVLEVGCGAGGVLREFQSIDAASYRLFGIDYLPDRLSHALQNVPHGFFACADGQNLPYTNHSFDLILQFTAFSSILDETVRVNMAKEMLRVLRPTGSVLWYDFWWNPTNPQTRGIRPAEIKNLFPGCRYQFRRITLAPPIARKVVPISWVFAGLLESIKIFNSHYLAIITPE